MESILNDNRNAALIKILNEGKADPNKIFEFEGKRVTAILQAINENNIQNLSIYLNFCKNLKIEEFNCTPIRNALNTDNYFIIKLLFNHFKINNEIYLPFTSNKIYYYTNHFNKLIKDVTPYIYFNDGFSIFTYAIRYNNECLLDNLKKIYKTNYMKYNKNEYINMLYIAIKYNNLFYIKKLLNNKELITNDIIDYAFKKDIKIAILFVEKGYYNNIIDLIDNVHYNESLFLPLIVKHIVKNIEKNIDIIEYCKKTHNYLILSNLNKTY